MGRSTPSLRASVEAYASRLRKAAEALPPDERRIVEEFLEDLESTISAFAHYGAVDPMEVLLLHVVRRMALSDKRNSRRCGGGFDSMASGCCSERR